MPLVESRSQFRLGRTLLRLDELDSAFGHLDKAAEGFEGLHRPDEAMRAYCTFGDAAYGARRFERARRCFSKARDVGDDVRTFDDHFPTLGLARAFTAQDELEKAADCIDDKNSPDLKARSPERRLRWAQHRGDLYMVHGAYPAALEAYEEMKEEARGIGRTDLFIEALLRAAVIYFYDQQYDSSAQFFDKAAKVTRKFGNQAHNTITRGLALYLESAGGGFPAATGELAELLEDARRRDNHLAAAVCSVCVADIRAANGHFAAAGELLAHARGSVTRLGRIRLIAPIGHRLDRLKALENAETPPRLEGALIGDTLPPALGSLNPDRLYG